MNLAISDVYLLSIAPIARYGFGNTSGLDAYSAKALHRVWGSVRFSWWFTTLMHRFPDMTDFDQRTQERELTYLAGSSAAQPSPAEQYVDIPF